MARYYTDPTTGRRVEIEKTHKLRNFVVLPGVGLVAVIAIASAVGGGNTETGAPEPVQVEQPARNAPAPAPEGAQGGTATVEVFGEGEAMVMVMTDGTSSNTVQLPHAQELPAGYASVSVSRSPSVEDYVNNGGPSSGSVGCRIVRDGKVIDERTAEGEFASVSCSKFR